MKQKPCKRCNGTGLEPDPSEVGKRMRHMREKAGISLRDAADKMGVSAAYLSDMERGNRAFSSDRIRQLEEVCK